ncbi:hypothetical protein CSOJ01_09054 [Colletotrichum sojae]|uniref:Uncharacterized protein n=1 Tax=Colletotrichum sojae TaxID=2175907 RepID=A0A8H6J4Q9_9PEZI|nr:hypothetical protein CSOJ01_09054 [Colletotrichum sojae]
MLRGSSTGSLTSAVIVDTDGRRAASRGEVMAKLTPVPRSPQGRSARRTLESMSHWRAVAVELDGLAPSSPVGREASGVDCAREHRKYFDRRIRSPFAPEQQKITTTMPRDHNNEDSRKSKSKGGRRGESSGSSSHTASSSSSARRTSHHSASASSSGRQSSSHGSARGYSATNPRNYQYNAGAQIDFSSQLAEQGSRSSHVDDTTNATAEDERWDRREHARTLPGVDFPHHQPRYGNASAQVRDFDRTFNPQGYRTQVSVPTYARELDIDSDDASNQGSPPYRSEPYRSDRRR